MAIPAPCPLWVLCLLFLRPPDTFFCSKEETRHPKLALLKSCFTKSSFWECFLRMRFLPYEKAFDRATLMALPAIGDTVGANCLANPLKSIFPPRCIFLAIKLATLSLAPVFCTCFPTWRFFPHVLVISFYQKPTLWINHNLFFFSPAVRRRVPHFRQRVFSIFLEKIFLISVVLPFERATSVCNIAWAPQCDDNASSTPYLFSFTL